MPMRAKATRHRDTLYILAIGVDKYPNLPGNDLHMPALMRKAFAEAMEKRASRCTSMW